MMYSSGGISYGIAAIFYAIVALIISGWAMRYLNWIFRAVLFIALLGLAYKNDQAVKLKYFFGLEWETNLVILLLVFFSVGALVGILAMFVSLLKLRREIAALKREIRTSNKFAEAGEPQQLHG